MTIATIEAAPTGLTHARPVGAAPTRTVVAYGFWIFILSDIVMFSALFAAYAVLAGSTAAKGLPAAVLRRLLCFSLFWHALDIVWIGVMTLVYLMGVQ